MFPDAEDAPAFGFEGAVDEAVAGFVGGEFAEPEFGVVGGQVGVFGAAVPEAAVDKNGEFVFREDEVAVARLPPINSKNIASKLDDYTKHNY